MTDEKIQQYKQRLFGIRDQVILNERRLLEQVQTPVGNPEHNNIATSSIQLDTVGASEGDEEVAIGLYENVEHTRVEVISALERVAAGTFGICESCGKRIAQSRLNAIPYARCCTACSR